jgi:hypothetical protein
MPCPSSKSTKLIVSRTNYPARVAAQPEEITSVIAFLASDDASVVMAEICS